MNRKNLQTLLFLVVAVMTISSCVKDDKDTTPELPQTQDFSHKVASDWMTLYLDVERFTPGYRPPVSARAAAYISLAAYEAAQPGMSQDYKSLGSFYFGLNIPKAETAREYHWPTCLNAAYARSFAHFFPTAPTAQRSKIFALENQLKNSFETSVSQEVFNRSVKFGQDVADAVFEWSRTDLAGHEAYLRNHDPSYIPPSGPGRWQPTYPDYTPALLPRWGQVRTFAATQDDTCPPPLEYSTDPNSQLYAQAREVQIIVNNIKAGQNYEDRWIADFWSDDCPILTFTPAGRFVAVANQVVTHKNVSLDLAAYTYAKVCMGLSDAGVRAWNEKYRYNLQRPIDYIRETIGATNWNTIMCPDGSGQYFTPPFPAYPSGHATFGAVAAEVLTDIYGHNYPMVDRCHEGRSEFISTPRSFQNFYEMAAENAYSRIPIGVHFRIDAEAGVNLGYRIGRKVNQLPWK